MNRLFGSESGASWLRITTLTAWCELVLRTFGLLELRKQHRLCFGSLWVTFKFTHVQYFTLLLSDSSIAVLKTL